MDVRSSRLFCVQIFFTLLIPVLAVARFLLQAFLYKGGHIYGYMVSSFKANILYVSNFWDGENFVIQTFISRHVFGFGTRDQRWIIIATNISCPCAVGILQLHRVPKDGPGLLTSPTNIACICHSITLKWQNRSCMQLDTDRLFVSYLKTAPRAKIKCIDDVV